MALQVAGRGHHQHAEIGRERRRDHVLRQRFVPADAGIEAYEDEADAIAVANDTYCGLTALVPGQTFRMVIHACSSHSHRRSDVQPYADLPLASSLGTSWERSR